MVFLGDVAHPFRTVPRWNDLSGSWEEQVCVMNLEGGVVEAVSEHLKKRVLVNHCSLLDLMGSFGGAAAVLANNHITDVPEGITGTSERLVRVGVGSMGAGTNSQEASRPLTVWESGTQITLLAFGWPVIQCRSARKGSEGVNPLEPQHVLESIERCRETLPGGALILNMHWNYEGEVYPQPAHRQLAFAAIDAGVDAVVGHHPHCVGGIEFHRDRPIVYSLGNWWLPQGVFFGGDLSYPERARLQLAFEWAPGRDAIAHWFEYRQMGDEHSLGHLESEPVNRSRRIEDLTPFRGISHQEYKHWFRRHRLKRRGLPIYYDYDAVWRNRVKDGIVKLRHVILRAAEVFGVRGLLPK